MTNVRDCTFASCSFIIFIFAMLLLLFSTVLQAKTIKYSGEWFDVMIPSDFTIKPSLNNGSTDTVISAFFISPDQKVAFYIFAPQWSGDPVDIKLKPGVEKEISRTSKRNGGNQITWFSYKNIKTGYTRAYQQTENEEGTSLTIIGIEYDNESAYEKYKNQYLAFKKSLVQYAD